MESKTVVYTPDVGSGSGSGMMAMLAPLLQQKGIDPNLLMALNSKGNGNGFGGDGSWFLWIIFLFFLFPLFGRNGWGNDGGNGGGYGVAGIPNLINNDAGRELLMSAIQGNGQAINNLATNLNCSIGQVQNAINGVMSQVQQVGNQVGQSSMQIIMLSSRVTVRSLNRLLHAAAKTVWRSVSKRTHCKMPLTALRLVRKEALLLLHMKLNVRLVICKMPSRIAHSRFLPVSVRLKCAKCRTRLINFVRRIAHLKVLP